MADSLIELNELLISRKVNLTTEESKLLNSWKQSAVRDFGIGAIGASLATWLDIYAVLFSLQKRVKLLNGPKALVLSKSIQEPKHSDDGYEITRRLHNLFRINLAVGAGWFYGKWRFAKSLDSGVELILSQHGTRLQKELGEIMLKKYQHNPPVLQFVSKYFYSENVYDDDSTDKPKPRWRFRSTYGEIFSSHEVEGDDSSSKKSHSENTDLRKTNLERKQINMNGVGAAVALESTEDPFDCILGHQGNTEEIHHLDASSPLPKRRSHSTRRSHSRRRMHRHENVEG